MNIPKNFGLKRAKQLFKAFNGEGRMGRRYYQKSVMYVFKPKNSDFFVKVYFGKYKVVCIMSVAITSISTSPKELYKVYQYINECIIKEKAYDSRNNN